MDERHLGGDRKLVGILIEHNLTGRPSVAYDRRNRGERQSDPVRSVVAEPVVDAPRNWLRIRSAGGAAPLGRLSGRRYEQLEKGDREALQADYRRRMYRLGERHRYRYPDGRTVEAVLRGVRPSGELLVELPDGRTEGYLFREIEFVIEGKQTARTDGTGCVLKK